MDSPSPPATPDPYVTADAQAGLNKESALLTAQLNRPNQYTPYGSLTWEQGPSTRTFNQDRYDKAVAAARAAAPVASAPGSTVGGYSGDGEGNIGIYGWGWRQPTATSSPVALPDRNDAQFYDETPGANWSSKVTLDPRVQAILDAQLQTSQGLNTATQSALGRVQDTFAQPAPTPNDEMRKRVEDAVYGRHISRLDPQFQEQEEKMRSHLMNRGLVEGSEAWQDQLDLLMRAKNDAYSGARQEAITYGGDEMARQYGMEMSGRNNVLNELSALRSGQQVDMPQFQGGQSGAGVAAPNIGDMIAKNYEAEMGRYNADVASDNATMGSAASLAMMAMMFSDRRLKRNITRIGTHPLGIGWYSYEYVWGERSEGVMADEVEAVRPDAVFTHPSGFKMVNYGAL